MSGVFVCFAIIMVSGAGLTTAMVAANPIALLQWYQHNYPALLHQLNQLQPTGQPKTNPPQALPSAPSAAQSPQTPSAPALASAPQQQLPPAPQPSVRPTPQANPNFQPNPNRIQFPVQTAQTNAFPASTMPNMRNADPVRMMLMARRMKGIYTKGDYIATVGNFFPGGWVSSADGSDATVLGRDFRKYSIDSNRICRAGICLPIF